MWGRSPDISEWRDVVLESTEVAPDGQRLARIQMNKPPGRRQRERTYIACETPSDQLPPWLSSLSFRHRAVIMLNLEDGNRDADRRMETGTQIVLTEPSLTI